MATWTDTPIESWEKPPGPLDPPAPDAIQPTDPGWSDYVHREIEQSGLKWGKGCFASIHVEATGKTRERAVDGDAPDDYATDSGWKEDRTYETTPPEPYQDFTRWVRHYPKMRRQKCAEYKAFVGMICGQHIIGSKPKYFWVPVGQPTAAGPADVYYWTVTSGLETGADGKSYKWRKSGKKPPPPYHFPEPMSYYDLGPQETPPERVIHPPPIFPPIHIGGYPDHFTLPPDFGLPGGSGPKELKWIRIGDLFDKAPPKDK